MSESEEEENLLNSEDEREEQGAAAGLGEEEGGELGEAAAGPGEEQEEGQQGDEAAAEQAVLLPQVQYTDDRVWGWPQGMDPAAVIGLNEGLGVLYDCAQQEGGISEDWCLASTGEILSSVQGQCAEPKGPLALNLQGIQDAMRRNPDRPFCLIHSRNITHTSAECRELQHLESSGLTYEQHKAASIPKLLANPANTLKPKVGGIFMCPPDCADPAAWQRDIRNSIRERRGRGGRGRGGRGWQGYGRGARGGWAAHAQEATAAHHGFAPPQYQQQQQWAPAYAGHGVEGYGYGDQGYQSYGGYAGQGYGQQGFCQQGYGGEGQGYGPHEYEGDQQQGRHMGPPAQQWGPQAAAAGYGEPDARGSEARDRREDGSAAAAAAAAGAEERPRKVAKVTAAAAPGATQQREREVKEPQLAQGLAGAAWETVTAAMQQGNAAALAAALLLQTVEQRDAATAQRAHEAGRKEMRLERKAYELQRKLEQVARKAAADGMQDSFQVTRAQQESQQLRAQLAARMGQPYSCTEQDNRGR